MRELYDAASGRGGAAVEPRRPPRASAAGGPAAARRRAEPGASRAELGAALEPAPAQPAPAAAGARDRSPQRRPAQAGAGDLDGARLIALNMALNGESRADTERYLAENFELPDRLEADRRGIRRGRGLSGRDRCVGRSARATR